MGVTPIPKVNPNWLLSIHLTLLCHTANVLTEPGLGRPTGTTNVLWASQLSTFSSLLGAGHTVDDPSSVTGDGTLDGVEFPSEVAGVPGSVAGVGARTAGSSFPTLVETLGGLSPRLSVVGWTLDLTRMSLRFLVLE